MSEIIRRTQQRMKALTLKQVCFEALVLGSVGGLVSFCLNRLFWGALLVVAIDFSLMLLSWYWLRRT